MFFLVDEWYKQHNHCLLHTNNIVMAAQNTSDIYRFNKFPGIDCIHQLYTSTGRISCRFMCEVKSKHTQIFKIASKVIRASSTQHGWWEWEMLALRWRHLLFAHSDLLIFGGNWVMYAWSIIIFHVFHDVADWAASFVFSLQEFYANFGKDDRHVMEGMRKTHVCVVLVLQERSPVPGGQYAWWGVSNTSKWRHHCPCAWEF
jgi:hypothetical protein